MRDLIRNISPLSKVLLVIAILIIMLHFSFHQTRVLGMHTSLFYLDEEITLGALYTSCLAFFAGLLNLELYLKKRIIKCIGWVIVFGSIALDEYLSIHEFLNDFIKRTYAEGSFMSNLASTSWVLTIGLVFLLVALLILREIIKEKNKRIKSFMILGLLTYVLVITLELLGGQTYGKDIYLVFVGLEEGMEMIGTIFFIQAFLVKVESIASRIKN